MKTWYVPYGHGQDRDEIRIHASTRDEAAHLAYLQVGPLNGEPRPAKPTVDKQMIRIIKSMRKRKSTWTSIAWHLRISVPTVKKYYKLPLDKTR